MLNQVRGFLQQPFNAQGSAFQWFLFIGLIIVCLYLWSQIAKDWQHVAGSISGE